MGVSINPIDPCLYIVPCTAANLSINSRDLFALKDVSKLGRRWYVKNPNITNGGPFTNEVEINLNMLRALMLYGIGGQVYCTDIVAVDQCAPRQWSMQFL